MSSATRSSAMDELGDPNAPPGSRAWAVAVRMDIQTTLNDINGDARHLRVMIDLIREHKGYRQLADAKGRAFATFQAFCEAKAPFGLGYDPSDIDAIIRERTARAAQERAEHPLSLGPVGRPTKKLEEPPEAPAIPTIHGPDPGGLPFGEPERPKEGEGGKDSIRIISPPTHQGTTADYLAARIARDRPDIQERMKTGEFRSVRAAAREAGIVRPTVQIYTDRPRDAAKAILKHFQGDRLEALIRALQEGLQGDPR